MAKHDKPLSGEVLRPRSDPKSFPFATTAELEPLGQLLGQDRALDAIQFGTAIRQPGFNVFVMGRSGSGRHSSVRAIVEERAEGEAAPDDWAYVNNFESPHKPRALRMQPGRAAGFRDMMDALVNDLAASVPALFESEEYRTRRQSIDEKAESAHEEAFDELKKMAGAQDIAILRTPMGYALAPVADGEVIKPDAFNELAKDDREAIQNKIETLEKELARVIQRVPDLQKERRLAIRALNAEFAETAVVESMAPVIDGFSDIDGAARHLAAVRADLIENVDIFFEGEAPAMPTGMLPASPPPQMRDPRFRRYAVNVIVPNGPGDRGAGAPIASEPLPTLANLVGRVEHLSQMGTLTTDFTLIKPGALHRANGGYLILDARQVLSEPFAWEALKRSLTSECIKITTPAEQLSLVSTVSLEPDPIPLAVKVVLVGEPLLYYLLVELDPDFSDLFKVQADFENEVERSSGNTDLYARMLATIVQRENLKPLTAEGAARSIDEAVRVSGDAERISLHVGEMADILREADHWAGEAGSDRIDAGHIEHAVNERIRRASRLRDRSHENITRDTVLIDTDGEATGQVNGLAVLSVGRFAFGRPTRITARVRMGSGKVVDIERETKLGGPLHSKGVLILSSFLASRYALDSPVSLWASLVFEQSYGGVEGDSASSAELYALLSALAAAPLRQSLAVTGSVNQLGQVQAIGGVNEKIEGFFDICAARGLTGNQGVLVPAANVKHLMLRPDVVEAVEAGQFAVHAVDSIDHGIELLTGVPAGERVRGEFPDNSINGRVEATLRRFARARQDYSHPNADPDKPENTA